MQFAPEFGLFSHKSFSFSALLSLELELLTLDSKFSVITGVALMLSVLVKIN